jgi:selenoprotein W-related protein
MAVGLTAKLLTELKRRITALELEPSTGGCFELTVGDELIYSKLETGRFPQDDAMVEEVRKRLK